MLKYIDAESLKKAFDGVEVISNMQKRRNALIEVLNFVRPINPEFCVYDTDYKELCYNSYHRELWIREFCSWCLPPEEESIDILLEFIGGDRVLELGAGAGMYSRILQLLGVDILPTDVHGYNEPGDYWNREGDFTYLPLEVASCDEATIKYGNDFQVLMGVWQDTNLSLDAFKHFTGSKAIVIGEVSGCTSSVFPSECDPLAYRDPSSSESLEDDLGKNWKMVNSICPIDWLGVYTKIMLFKRIEG